MENLTAGLFFDGIDKHFGGTYALKDVSLSVGRGEIVALLGENGAGKSTLIKVLGGIHQPDAGRVLIMASLISIAPPDLESARRLRSSTRTLG